MTEYILCAAIWYKDAVDGLHQPKNVTHGVVICGHNHAHIIQAVRALTGKPLGHMGEYTQGFLTNSDLFVDRKIGMEIALAAKQVDPDKCGKSLFAEDLYQSIEPF